MIGYSGHDISWNGPFISAKHAYILYISGIARKPTKFLVDKFVAAVFAIKCPLAVWDLNRRRWEWQHESKVQ